MALVRWNPTIAPSFRTFVEDFFGDWKLFNNDGASLVPAVNIKETDNLFLIELAAPGLKKKDFKIEVQNGVLMISSEHKEEMEEKKENFTRKEFNFTKFSRSFTLPENSNPDMIKATYKDGLLIVELPKIAKAVPAPKQIEIL